MNTTITAMDARKRFGEILNNVFYRGVSTVIERKGKPIARIVPVLDDRAAPARNISSYAGIWTNKTDVSRMKATVRQLRKSPGRTMHPL